MMIETIMGECGCKYVCDSLNGAGRRERHGGGEARQAGEGVMAGETSKHENGDDRR